MRSKVKGWRHQFSPNSNKIEQIGRDVQFIWPKLMKWDLDEYIWYCDVWVLRHFSNPVHLIELKNSLNIKSGLWYRNSCFVSAENLSYYAL